MNRTFPVLFSDPGKEAVAGTFNATPDLRVSGPLVSCLMVSRGRRFPAALAIESYRTQTYQPRELVIVSAAERCEIRSLIDELDDPTIRYVPAAPASLGELRNVAVARSQGDLVCQWDDDDLASADRIELMLATLGGTAAKACFLDMVTLWWPGRRVAATSSQRIWENTMLVHRSVLPIYPAQQMGEDTEIAKMIVANHRVAALSAPESYLYIMHGGNVCSAEHFDMLFGAASSKLAGAAYDEWMEDAGGPLPLRLYAEELERRASSSNFR